MLSSIREFNEIFETGRGFSTPGTLPARSSNNKYRYSIDAYKATDSEKGEIEEFIKTGFNKVYNADISVSMPILLAVKNGALKAALGIRSAKETLFIEQYLPTTIERCLEANNVVTERHSIAEIGHLYSNSEKFTLPLLLTAGVSLFLNQYRYITFCATTHVSKLISGAGISLIDLGEADKDKLSNKGENWGTYYDTQPRVIAISTFDIIDAITSNPKFLKIFSALVPRIKDVSLKMAGVSL